jgi:purine-binding chemotaxis protein CheW
MSEGREAPDIPSGAGEARLFCVRVLGGRYAFEASLVAEVVRLGPLTRLPAAPPFLPGVFSHRGEILPVLDVNQLLGMRPLPLGAAVRAAVVRAGLWKVAVLTEAVEGLVELDRAALQPAPAEAAGGTAEFLIGVPRDRRGELAVLDLPRLVDAARARSVGA